MFADFCMNEQFCAIDFVQFNNNSGQWLVDSGQKDAGYCDNIVQTIEYLYCTKE